MPPQGFVPPKPKGNEPLTKPKPIAQAYTPLPDDPNSKLKKLYDFVKGFTGFGSGGLTNPQSSNSEALGDAFGQLNPEKWLMTPFMGMTKFIKPIMRGEQLIRVPDVATRTERTVGNLEKLSNYLKANRVNPEDYTKTMEIANRYPRTMAHISDIRDLPEGHPFGGRMVTEGIKTGKVEFNPARITLQEGPAAASIFAHELQHVGQNIADTKFLDKYKIANENVGYYQNPYEIAARKGAANRTLGGNLNLHDYNMFERNYSKMPKEQVENFFTNVLLKERQNPGSYNTPFLEYVKIKMGVK